MEMYIDIPQEELFEQIIESGEFSHKFVISLSDFVGDWDFSLELAKYFNKVAKDYFNKYPEEGTFEEFINSIK